MNHSTQLRVRFSDTDMLGHVNNASYLSYLEEARIQFFEDLGITEVPLIVASIKADFRTQAFFRQNLTIETAIRRVGNSSFDFVNRIKDSEKEQTIFEALTTIVHFNYKTQKSETIPDDLRQKLSSYIEPA